MDRTSVFPFGLRLQPDLKNLVKQSAELNKRSMNAEIVFQLEAVYSAMKTKSPAEAATSPSHSSTNPL